MLLDELAEAHHQLKMGVFSRNGESVCLVAIVFSQTLFEVLDFWKYEEVVRCPVEEECLDILIALRGAASVGECSRGGLQGEYEK